MDQFNPTDYLNQQFDGAINQLNAGMEQQMQLLQEYRGQLLEGLGQSYSIERKYIEAEPGDVKQRNAKLLQLNRKYELQAAKLDQDLQPDVLKLQQVQQATRAKLDAKRQEGLQRLQLVQQMLDNGTIHPSKRESALKEQLDAVGLNVPISLLTPPQRDLADIRSEASFLAGELKKIFPAKQGQSIYGPDGNFRPDVLYSPSGYEEDAEPISGPELRRLNQVRWRYEGLRLEALNRLTKQNVGPIERGMATAGATQSTPIADQVRELVQPAKKKVTRELVQQLKNRGLTKQQAQQWLEENGYDVSS